MSNEKELKDITIADHNCVNCVYFDKFPIQKKPDNILGACKANPPFPASRDNSDNALGVWPLVLGTFWCGLFDFGDEKEKI